MPEAEPFDRTDKRPTKAQFKALPRLHKRKHLILQGADGNPLTPEAHAAFKAKLLKRRQTQKPPKVRVINGRGSTQQSTGIRKISGASKRAGRQGR